MAKLVAKSTNRILRKTLLGRANGAAIGRFVACALALSFVPFLASPAQAGVSSASLSIQDPTTESPENRFTWNFTTGTTSSLTAATFDVPTTTDVSPSNRALMMAGDATSYAATANNARNQITTDIDVRARIAPKAWTAATTKTIVAKWGSSGASRAYRLDIGTTGKLKLTTYNGADAIDDSSSVEVPGPNGAPAQNGVPVTVRATRQLNVAGSAVTKFFVLDETTNAWVQIGTDKTQGATTIQAGSSDVRVGATSLGTDPFNGDIYWAEVRSGIDGPKAVDFNGGYVDPASPTTWPSPLGETWNLTPGDTNPADVGGSLDAFNVVGLPANGTAQRRFNDGNVRYDFGPTSTSVPTNTAVSVGLAGLVTPHDRAGWSSAIKTWNGATQVESGSATAPSPVERTIENFAGSPQNVPWNSDTAGSQIRGRPSKLAVTGNTVYWYDYYLNGLFKLDNTTGQVRRVVGNLVYGEPSGTAHSSSMEYSKGIAVDNSGNLAFSQEWAGSLDTVDTGSNQIVNDIPSSGLQRPSGMIHDTSGNLWIANTGTFKVLKATGAPGSRTLTTMAGTGTYGTPSSYPMSATAANIGEVQDVAVDTSGNFYFCDYNAVYKVDNTGQITLLAGGGWDPTEGALADTTHVNRASSIALNPAATELYIAMEDGAKVRKVDLATKRIYTVAGTGSSGFSGDGGLATSAQLSAPTSVRFDSSGNLFIADCNNGRIRKVATDGTITTVMGQGQTFTGRAIDADFQDPQAMASDGNGNIIVADYDANAIRKIDAYGNASIVAGFPIIKTWKSTSTYVMQPTALALATDGTIYLATEDSYLHKIPPGGAVTKIAEVPDGVSTYGMAIGPSGDVFLSTSESKIMRMTSAGVLSPFGNTAGIAGFSGDGGDVATARFNGPHGLAFTRDGNLLIADSENHRIRMVDAFNVVTTVAGNPSGVDTDESRATSLNIQTPLAVLAAPDGAVFFTDGDWSYVGRFTVGGLARRIAGVRYQGGADGSGGPARDAHMQGPQSLAFRGNDLLVGSWGDKTIRSIKNVVSEAPRVNNDKVSLAKDTTADISVLSNDQDLYGGMNPRSVVLAGSPIHGTAVVNTATNNDSITRIRYTPGAGYTGTDYFSYRACDITRVNCRTATVNITVGAGDVQTLTGGFSEGDTKSLGAGFVSRLAAHKYYDYALTDDSLLRQIDPLTGQSVVIAGNASKDSSGNGGPAQFAGIGDTTAIAVGPFGRFYLTATRSGTIRRIDFDGNIAAFAGPGTTTAASTNFSNATAIAVDACGTFYVGNGNTVYQFTEGSSATAINGFGSVDQIAGGLGCEAFVADSSSNVIKRVSSGAANVVAGTGTAGAAGDGGTATTAQLNSPHGVAVAGNGAVVIADTNNGRLRSFFVGGSISTVTNSTGLTLPGSTASTSAGTLVAGGDGVIRVVNASGSSALNAAGIANSTCTKTKESRLTSSTTSPMGFIVFASDEVFVNSAPGVVRKNEPIYDDNLCAVTAFNGQVTGRIGQIVRDSGSFAYFSDVDGHQVKKININNGAVTVVAGTGASGSTGDGGPAASATLVSPTGLAYRSDGTLFISDAGANKVRKVAPDGTITTWAGTGASGRSGDSGPATSATLDSPQGMGLDPAGNLYVADKNNNVIRVIDAFGFITTFAGSGVSGNTAGGGNPWSARLNAPSAIAIAPNGEKYIGDASGYIRKVDGSSTFTNWMGSGNPTEYADNGTLSAARIGVVSGLQVLGTKLYFFDQSAGRLRVFNGVTDKVNIIERFDFKFAPATNGRATTEYQVVFRLTSDATLSKATLYLPTPVGTPTLVKSFGTPTAPTLGLNGSNLTINYSPSQAFKAGINYAVSFTGLTLSTAHSTYMPTGSVEDASWTRVGWSLANMLNLHSQQYGNAGYTSPYEATSSLTKTCGTKVSLDPATATSNTFNSCHTLSGKLVGQALSVNPASLNASTGAAFPMMPTTPSSPAAQPVNTWGVVASSPSATVQPNWTGGKVAGISGATQIMTNAHLGTASTFGIRAKVDYLQPAGRYTSTLTYSYSPGH